MTQNPLLLKMHGIDPDAAKAQLDLSKAVHEKIKLHKQSDDVKKQRQEELDTNNTYQWTQWIISYHKVLKSQLDNLTDISATDFEQQRLDSMNLRVNPAFILRNYQMEEAIKLAEKHDDFSGVKNLLKRAHDPFKVQVNTAQQRP